MELPIYLEHGKAKYIQIYEQIKTAILNKTVAAHSKLPSKRELSTQLGVSIHTVREAYEQLLAEGYIMSRERSGYFVSSFEQEWLPKTINIPNKDLAMYPNNQLPIDFNSGHVDTANFPYHIWKRMIRRYIEESFLVSSPWQGEWALRSEIAKYVGRSRGVQCEAGQVFLYSGTQMQLQDICQFFGLDIRVGMEDPGFIRAKAVLANLVIKMIPIPVDDYGVSIPDRKIDLLYTTPAHQFPLGMIMSIERRIKLLKWANEHKSFIIEDDYDSEFRYNGLPIPSLTQIDQLQHVIYFGSFSKSFIPSIRMSYMILPITLVEEFEKYNIHRKSTVSRIDQLAVADFMKEGYFDRHLAKMRTTYRKKHQALLQAIEYHLPEDFELIGENSGLHIVLKLPPNLTEQYAIHQAAERGVRIYPASISFIKRPKTHMVILGYGGLTIEEIKEGIQRLQEAWL
ncbi:PLP-dependent aminotransferase family protein [Bacillus sp. DTU_2020_1000418_1_SI_GHA_SEK_038]|uniref:MocR-like pyridoxine biosynthesis transcription factor PdxR n=1 Tax=Bacillus sp. DTU_2020_1000418_1_SI_GHA_SEK_038 TaxID=3077585 RepID=UPI0028E2A06F|nr:PLP-dependent aminotransferase family protein [Bacillus sp. DTU_2020_1000418_1_SI_GHA_SEK_038]WNS73626.1 PLP-dependent aminotransferase family protein [Bacillus sp. DTU_2020_1000418_1_SI_GHA_SEK_038]